MPPHESKTGRVLERSRSERVDSLLDDPEVDRASAPRRRARRPLGAAARPRPRDRRDLGLRQAPAADARFTDDDLRLAEIFAARAAVAVDLSERVERDALRRIVAGAGAGAAAARPRAARRDRPGADLDPARAEAARGGRRREAVGAQAARSGRGDAAGRAPAGGRAAAEGARRLRARPGAGAATPDFAEQTGISVDLEASSVTERLAARGRDRPLPDRPGGADERRQARARAAGQRRCCHPADGRIRP